MTIPNLNDKGVEYVRDHLKHFPRPDQAAADNLREWAKGQGLELDPGQVDVVTLHYQPSHDGRHWEGVVTASTSLTQALLGDWQGESANDVVGDILGSPWAGKWPGKIDLVEQLRPSGPLGNGGGYKVFNGLFRRTEPQRYDNDTLVDLSAQTLQQYIWHLDFHRQYKKQLDSYWSANLSSYITCARLNFLAACNKQVAEGSLSEPAVRLCWQVAGVSKAGKTLRVRALNVYGYAATDLLYFSDAPNGPVVLYIPGNASPLHVFDNEGLMKDWFAEQCKATDKRAALMAHFASADEGDGLSYSGLATAMAGLAAYPDLYHLDPNRPGFTVEGTWPAREYVNYKAKDYSPVFTGDIFEALAQRHRRRSYRDADTLITTNSQVLKARWQGYMTSAINYLAPLALVVPELAIVFAVGGVAQFGLGLDMAIEGRNQEEKATGAEVAVFGLLNAAPLLHGLAAKTSMLWRYESSEFVMPGRFNGKIGYLLSPPSAPRLPGQDIPEFFHKPQRIEPAEGGDPAVGRHITRIPRSGAPDYLQYEVGIYPDEVHYDLKRDAFYYAAQGRDNPEFFRIGDDGKYPVKPIKLLVKNADRTKTLKGLGVDLELPVKWPSVPLKDAKPIPRRVFSLWVGDKVLSEELMTNMAHNHRSLTAGGYEFKLYLSEVSPEAYAENLRLLDQHAPGLTVMPLERQPGFQALRDSINYEQYQAALTGNGKGPAHYASAADVLRYRMLHHEGGIYMDVDDTVYTDTQLKTENAFAMLAKIKSLKDVPMATAADGLLFAAPVRKEDMFLNSAFNNSLIGSHAGNPTLERLFEEMHRRYTDYPTLYDTLPLREENMPAACTYARGLAYMTGPTLLTDIVDRHLPILKQLRQIDNLARLKPYGVENFIDAEREGATTAQLMPMSVFAHIGNSQSWARL